MTITNRINIKELREKYDVLAGWGAGRIEYIPRYNPWLFPLDYMIDMDRKLEGKTLCGMKISSVDILDSLKDKMVCFIVFPQIEQSIEREINKHLNNYDMVISRLVEYEGGVDFYSKEGEDLLFMQLIKKLGLKDPSYLDIGVCHPVIRNNTYMLYANGFKKGVLVEPNPDMCELIREYRPENILVNMGACADESKSLRYYRSPNASFVGHNTFDEKEAARMGFIDYQDVPVDNINHIIETCCGSAPDILDLDTEGMDFSLVRALDTDRYRIKMICVETIMCGDDAMNELLEEKGYAHFAATRNNSIYVSKELLGRFVEIS